jgi:hypothetical protein
MTAAKLGHDASTMKRYIPLAVALWAVALGVVGTEAQVPPPAPPTPAPVMTPPGSSPIPGTAPVPNPQPVPSASVSPMP